MEITYNSPLSLLLLLMPIVAGTMAALNGRSFWVWFLISIPLPFLANLLLLVLTDQSAETQPKPVENDELFDHLFLSALLPKQRGYLAT